MSRWKGIEAMTAPTSDERREVAARLRDDDHGYETEYDFLVQALGMPRESHGQCDWPKVHERLADLIDPTCEMEAAGDVPALVKNNLETFFCSECGSPIYNDSNPSYCLYCGARLVERGER